MQDTPSGLSVPMCKWGLNSSIISRNPIPNRKPTAAGKTDHRPLSATISMDGINSDHTDAATITPEAKPNNVFCKRGAISSRIRKTNAAPSMVPNRGMSNPKINAINYLAG